MDEVGLILLGILVVLAFPVVAIIALVVALNARADARSLRERLDALDLRRPAAPAPAQAAAFALPPPVAETPQEPVILPPPPPARLEPQPVKAPPAASAAAPQTAPASATLEERFGTQWVVWIGGLALALGGIFLVRYSIEQGLLGPGVRILLAAVFAATLIAAGEWTRRKEIAFGVSAIQSRQIPGILTAAGTIAAYATVYAAFALYHFLSPAAAFILLGVVALATLAAALLHGPALAGLGLVGAFVTPLLVSTDTPSYWALYLYLAIVTAAAFALARMRLWRWLAIAAVVLGALWTLPGIDYPHVDALGAHLFHVIAGFALAAALIVSGLLYGPSAEPGKTDEISSGAIGAYLIAVTILVLGSVHDSAALLVFTALTVATVAIVWRTEAALFALPVAGLMVLLVMAHWIKPVSFETLVLAPGVTGGVIPGPPTGSGLHLALGALFAGLFGLSGYAAQGRSENPLVALLWSATAAITPIAILIALYLRVTEFDRSIPFAGLALLLAALYGYATELLSQRQPRPGSAGSAAIFATGAVASLALALTFALDKGWLTVGLALMVPGIAWISEQRPLPARMANSAAILFTVLLAMLEIRHFMKNGDVFRDSTALAEIALQVAVGLAMTIGLEWLRGRSKSIVHDVGALIVGGMTLAAILFGLVSTVNPLITGRPIGGAFFNLILLGYGIPAVLAAILALIARTTRPLAYRFVAATAAVGLFIAYLTLEVRTLFHGAILTRGATSDVEQYTYSTAWLIFGVVLLIAGLMLRSQPARLASAAMVALTIGKGFLVDMAGLTGIFRALSFIGLGIVLVGNGWLYQRLLFPSRGPVISTDVNGAGKTDG